MPAFGSSHAPSWCSYLEHTGEVFSHLHAPDSNPKISRVALEVQFLLLIIFLVIRKYARSQSRSAQTPRRLWNCSFPLVYFSQALLFCSLCSFFDLMLPHSISRLDDMSETEQFPVGYYLSRFVSHWCVCSPIPPCLCNSCNPGVNAWRPCLRGYFQPPFPSSESLFFYMLRLLLEGVLAGGSLMEVGRQQV